MNEAEKNTKAKRPPRLTEEEADVILHEHLIRKFGDRIFVDADGTEHSSPKWAREKAAKGQTQTPATSADIPKAQDSATSAKPPKKTASRKAVAGRSPSGQGKGPDILDLKRRRSELKREIRRLRKAAHETK
jgi:hypothetical protein